jgi:hypothetical protein
MTPKRHLQPGARESLLSQPWFVYLNLALTFGAFAALYVYLPAKRDCAFVVNYNSSQLSAPIVQRNGDVWHKIAVITDLDHDSKHPEKKDTWSSFMKKGVLKVKFG